MSFDDQNLGKIRVLIVDDHILFAEGTEALLSFEPRILVVGISGNGAECIRLLSKTNVDVVLLDIKLPDICGTELIERIKTVQPEVKIIMLTGHSPDGYIVMSINKGANGFLLKDCSVTEMIQGILQVFNGDIYLYQGLKTSLQINNNNFYSSTNSKNNLKEILTAREVEIIKLISIGLQNKEIAAALGIKVRTANFHVCNILYKLNVSTRLEAVLQWANISK